MNILIRPALEKDVPAIISLIAELADTIGETSPLTGEYVLSYLAAPGSTVLVAEDEGRALGLLSYSLRPNLYHANNSCLIEELIVTLSAQGQGIGGMLVDALLDRMNTGSCAEISVTTMPDNLGAQKFYRAHGFIDEAIFLEKHL